MIWDSQQRKRSDMPYTVRKQKCKKSDGGSGSYVLSYTDKKGKKHRNCHSSRKGAKGQIAAIEAEGVQYETLIRSLIRKIIKESVLGLHGAGMSSKDLESRLGYGGIDLNKSGPVTDEEADAIAKKVAEEKPERIYAYSRGAAALSKAATDDDMPGLPPITYVAPAALRGWTDAPVPGVPGGSVTIIGDKDDKVPIKQACKIAQQAGTPLYVYPGKSHVSILYTHGEVGGDSFEIDPAQCAADSELPDWGSGGTGSKEDVEKQQKLAKNYSKGKKPKAEGRNTKMKLQLSELRRIIRSVIKESMHEEMDEQDLEEDEFTYAIAKAAAKGEKEVDIDGEKFPVKMSKEKAKDIVGKKQQK